MGFRRLYRTMCGAEQLWFSRLAKGARQDLMLSSGHCTCRQQGGLTGPRNVVAGSRPGPI